MLKTRAKLGMIGSAILIASFVLSCATRPPIRITSLVNQPFWLLIGGIDVSEDVGGDRMTIRSSELTFPDSFHIKNAPGPGESITVTLVRGGRIIYWGGDGEITNLQLNETVVVQLE